MNENEKQYIQQTVNIDLLRKYEADGWEFVEKRGHGYALVRKQIDLHRFHSGDIVTPT